MVWRWPWATEEWRWRLRDNALMIEMSGEPRYMCNWMSFTPPFFAWSCILSNRPPGLWWLSPGEWWDAVTWCGWDKQKKGHKYWKSRLRCQVYGLRGVYWRLCVCYLTWHLYPSLVDGESQVYCYIIVIEVRGRLG